MQSAEISTRLDNKDHVYLTIKEAIRDGRYPAGESLREQQVAESLGVSRTPVREAFRRLGAEGWLEVRPNYGVRVKVWSAQDVREIFEARVLIEPYLAGRAATRLPSERIDELMRLAESMKEIARDTPTADIVQAWYLANGAFHDILMQGGENVRLAQALRTMKEVPLIKWTFRNFDPEDRQRAVRQHIEIAHAVAQRDAALTESIMRSHMLGAQASVLRHLATEAGAIADLSRQT